MPLFSFTPLFQRGICALLVCGPMLATPASALAASKKKPPAVTKASTSTPAASLPAADTDTVVTPEPPPAPPPAVLRLHVTNPCSALDSCIDSILQNAGQLSMSASYEAMYKIDKMPRLPFPAVFTPPPPPGSGKNITVPSLDEQTDTMLRNRDLAGAEKALRQMLSRNSGNVWVWRTLVKVYQAQQDLQKARAAALVAINWGAVPNLDDPEFADRREIFAQAIALKREREEKLRQISSDAAAQGKQPALANHKFGEIDRPGLNCTLPEYPRNSVRNEEEGTVRIFIVLDTDGSVMHAEIGKSSGFRVLDSIALNNVSACRGVDVAITGAIAKPYWAAVEYVWQLED